MIQLFFIEQLGNGPNGSYIEEERVIEIARNMFPTLLPLVLAHEITHAKLHHSLSSSVETNIVNELEASLVALIAVGPTEFQIETVATVMHNYGVGINLVWAQGIKEWVAVLKEGLRRLGLDGPLASC